MPKKTGSPRKNKGGYEISVILPVYNEEDNILAQYNRIVESMQPVGKTYEVIFINDGSTDGSLELLEQISKKDKRIKIIDFRKNFGQTAAMAAGIDYASGDVIVFMDSDLQNESDDIINLINKIDEGYDVVSGWRIQRKDRFFSRRLPSMIANKMISMVSGVNLHDSGCSLKAFRSEIIKKVKLYGEMHRFIPIHASWIGARITEIPVRHHPRKFGKSKYGIFRTFKVILDLITIKFMGSFSTKPIYLYGGLGMITLFLGFLSGVAVILMKIYMGYNMTGNPFLMIFSILVMISAILALMGIQSEILIRIYHENSSMHPYYVKKVVNISDKDIPNKY